MNSITFSDKHPPCGYLGILGCNGYEKSESVVCLTANGDNNFLNEGMANLLGISEGSAYVDAIAHTESVRNRLEKLGIIAPQFHLQADIKSMGVKD